MHPAPPSSTEDVTMSTPGSDRRFRRLPRRAFLTAVAGAAAAAYAPRAALAGLALPGPAPVPAVIRPEPTYAQALAAAQQTSTLTYAYLWPTKTIDPHGTQDNPTMVALAPM